MTEGVFIYMEKYNYKKKNRSGENDDKRFAISMRHHRFRGEFRA
jgi:hypothetical protein